MSRVYSEDEADQRWYPHCAVDCDAYAPQHAPTCPAAVGLDVATGDETCAACTQPLDAGELYAPAPDGRIGPTDCAGIRCLPCHFTSTTTRSSQ